MVQVVGGGALLYVSVREYAVTHPHDNKISVLGTDDVTANLVILVRHSGSGAVGLAQVDQLFSYHGRTQVGQSSSGGETEAVFLDVAMVGMTPKRESKHQWFKSTNIYCRCLYHTNIDISKYRST